MKIYIQTNKATTNIFGLHTQPRKTTRYTNILKLVWGGGWGGGGGEGKRAKLTTETKSVLHNSHRIISHLAVKTQKANTKIDILKSGEGGVEKSFKLFTMQKFITLRQRKNSFSKLKFKCVCVRVCAGECGRPE